MKKSLSVFAVLLILVGCATTAPVVWEGSTPDCAYQVVGPVSVTEEVAESRDAMIQGIAGFISSDGRISSQIPPSMKAALDAQREKYKEMIFDKLAQKAKDHNADAVISAEYNYVPAYVSFSQKAIVTAKGMMVKYR